MWDSEVLEVGWLRARARSWWATFQSFPLLCDVRNSLNYSDLAFSENILLKPYWKWHHHADWHHGQTTLLYKRRYQGRERLLVYLWSHARQHSQCETLVVLTPLPRGFARCNKDTVHSKFPLTRTLFKLWVPEPHLSTSHKSIVFWTNNLMSPGLVSDNRDWLLVSSNFSCLASRWDDLMSKRAYSANPGAEFDPRTQVNVKENNWLQKVVLWPPHTCLCMPVHEHMSAHTQIFKN